MESGEDGAQSDAGTKTVVSHGAVLPGDIKQMRWSSMGARLGYGVIGARKSHRQLSCRLSFCHPSRTHQFRRSND